MALGMMLAVMGGMLVCVQNTFNAKVKERVGAWATTTLVLALGFLASLQGVQQLGPSHAISIVMVSQILFALLWDTLGWFGLEAIPFTWKTLVGIVLIVGGVLLFQLSGKKEMAHQKAKQIS